MDRECEVCLIPISDDQDFCNSCFDKVHPKEPKPECDHIVGFFAAETSYGAGLFQIEPGEDVSQYGSDVYYCKRCPECGEKINLKKND